MSKGKPPRIAELARPDEKPAPIYNGFVPNPSRSFMGGPGHVVHVESMTVHAPHADADRFPIARWSCECGIGGVWTNNPSASRDGAVRHAEETRPKPPPMTEVQLALIDQIRTLILEDVVDWHKVNVLICEAEIEWANVLDGWPFDNVVGFHWVMARVGGRPEEFKIAPASLKRKELP